VTGLYSGAPDDSVALRALGTDAIPATTGEALGAGFQGALVHSITPEAIRELGRETVQAGAQGMAAVDELGNPIDLGPITTLDADSANQKFGIPGQLRFDNPVPEPTARDLYEQKRADLLREDTISRWQHSVAGGAEMFGTEFGAGLLDPANIAASFFPVVGEARTAQLLARAGESFLPRAATRAGIGAVEGAAGTAALLPAQAFLAHQEQDDFTFADALRTLALGSAVGGVAHSVFGAIHDRSGVLEAPAANLDRLAGLDPENRETTFRGALAAMAEGRPVDVGPSLDLFEAKQAETELTQWTRQQQRLDNQADGALQQIGRAEGGAAQIEATRQITETRLADLHQQTDALRTELAEVQSHAAQAVDTETPQRMGAIDWEMAQPGLTAVRRQDLAAERSVLVEGAKLTPEGETLEQARSEAMARGIGAALQRIESQIRLGEGKGAAASQRQAVIMARASSLFETTSDRIQSQQQILQLLTERTLRRMAGRADASVSPEEIAQYSRAILANKADGGVAIRQALGEITSRAGAGTARTRRPAPIREARRAVPAQAPARDSGATALRQRQTEALSTIAAAARREPRLDRERISRAADAAAKEPTTTIQDVAKEIADLESLLNIHRQTLPTLVAREEPRAEVVAPQVRGGVYTAVPREPQRLISFLRAIGGIRDDGGEISHILGGTRFRPGLINNRRGLGLDDAALRAWEEGYFPERGERRPSINDLLDAIADDHRGQARYAVQDAAQVAAFRAALEHNSEVDRLADRLGIDTRTVSPGEFWKTVAEHLSLEGAAHEAARIDDAFEEALKTAESASREWAASRGDAWEPEIFYDRPQSLTLEELDAHYRGAQELSEPAGERAGGAGESGSAERDQGQVQAGAGPGERGAGPRRRGEPERTAESGGDPGLIAATAAEQDAEATAAAMERAAQCIAGGGIVAEATAAGEQTLVPGVKPITQADRLGVRATASLKSAKPQKGADEGLFDLEQRKQQEMF
jgi:hypothetical protein